MTVGELLSRMDAREFEEWSVFDQLEAVDDEVPPIAAGSGTV